MIDQDNDGWQCAEAEFDAEFECEPAGLPSLMSVTEVSAVFDRRERTIRRWISRGLLQPVRVGRSVFIRVDDVRDIISCRITERILNRHGGNDDAN